VITRSLNEGEGIRKKESIEKACAALLIFVEVLYGCEPQWHSNPVEVSTCPYLVYH
jgi:hypothetical protein